MPDVKMIATGRSGSSAQRGRRLARDTERVEHRSRASPSVTSIASCCVGAKPVAAITSVGAARSSTASRSRADRRSLTPAVIAPTFAAATVGEQVLGTRRQHERDDVAFGDPRRDEPGGDLVGDAVDVGVGQRPAALGDVGDTIAEPPGGRGVVAGIISRLSGRARSR